MGFVCGGVYGFNVLYMVIRFGQLAALGVAEEKAVGHALEIFGVRLGF